ncbi:MAG: hypothetical protein MJ086_05240 [Lachnospiraceae bacterium]|nr:hypothetical protein [Lachnospiraceae bacterium]
MISIILSTILLLLTAAAIGILTNRRTEECVPFAFLGTCFCLYVFYCLNILAVGRIIVYLLMATLVVFAVRKLIKEKKQEDWKTSIFTPAVAAFLLLSIFFYIYSFNLKPAVWDELRLWSAMPKAIHFLPYLQVGEGSLLYSTMQSYPPGMALLTYFLTAFQKTYYEFSPFFGTAVFGLALVLPAFKTINWKKWILVVPALIVFLLMPVLLTINGSGASGDWAYYYLSLFIDPVLGFLFGFGIYLAVNRPFYTKFSNIEFSLVLFMLPALKNTGAMYGAVVFFVAIVISLLEKRKKECLQGLPTILVLAASYFSWQLIIHTKGTGEFIDFNVSGISLQKISNVFSGITSWGKLPFLWIVLFFLAVGILMTLCLKDISKKAAGTAGLGILAGALCFFYGYTSHYGTMISSIHRYTQTLTFAMFIYLFMRLLVYVGAHGEIKKKSGILIMGIVELILCIVAVIVMNGYKTNQYSNKAYSEIENQIQNFSQKIEADKETQEPAKCYLALGGDIWKTSQKHETYYQVAVGTEINIQNIWCDKLFNEADWGEITDIGEMTEIWANSLAANSYEYVLIVEPDDEIKDAVSRISPTVEVKENMILAVKEGTGEYPVDFQIVH